MSARNGDKYGDQRVTCLPGEGGGDGDYVLRIRGLDRDQLDDFTKQLEDKLIADAGEAQDALRTLLTKLDELGAKGEEPFGLEVAMPVDKIGDLVTKIRDRMTSHTTVKYREFYLELSQALARARQDFFARLR